MHLMRMSSDLKLCIPSNNKQASVPHAKPLRLNEREEEEEQSPSFCSSSSESSAINVSSKIEGEEPQVKESRIDDNGFEEGDDDEGYHTPTSPRHRIPAVIECPPAPKKPSSLRPRFKKRKACCFVEIPDVELIFRAEIDEGMRRIKRPREEIASSE